MRIGCVTLAVLLSCSLILADDKGDWREYTSEAGHFKILFPVEPMVGKVPNQKPEMHSVVVKRQSAEGLGYTCYWIIQEEPFKNKESQTAYLKGMQEGAVKSSKGKLDGEKEIDLNGLQGREFSIKISDSDYVVIRVYVQEKHVYTLSVWGKDKKAVQSSEADKFFKSFVAQKPPKKDEEK